MKKLKTAYDYGVILVAVVMTAKGIIFVADVILETIEDHKKYK